MSESSLIERRLRLRLHPPRSFEEPAWEPEMVNIKVGDIVPNDMAPCGFFDRYGAEST